METIPLLLSLPRPRPSSPLAGSVETCTIAWLPYKTEDASLTQTVRVKSSSTSAPNDITEFTPGSAHFVSEGEASSSVSGRNLRITVIAQPPLHEVSLGSMSSRLQPVLDSPRLKKPVRSQVPPGASPDIGETWYLDVTSFPDGFHHRVYKIKRGFGYHAGARLGEH
jgi:hypothetical protein